MKCRKAIKRCHLLRLRVLLRMRIVGLLCSCLDESGLGMKYGGYRRDGELDLLGFLSRSTVVVR